MAVMPTSPAPVKSKSARAPRPLGAPIRTPDEIERLRCDLAANSEFNQLLHRISETLHVLRSQVAKLATLDGDDLARSWCRAGLPPVADDDRMANGFLALFDDMPREAAGFLWALGAFQGSIEANLIGHKRTRRSR